MDDREREIRSKRMAWRMAPPGGRFTRRDLSPKSAYQCPVAMPQTITNGPRQRAVADHMFDPETMFIRFQGVGQPGDGCAARIWGIERTVRGLAGRFLCDLDVRLAPMRPITDSKVIPAGTRFADHVEFIEDMAPMPGVLRSAQSGLPGVFPEVLLGSWGYAIYVLEMACVAPAGVRPVQSCSAMWRAYTMGPPRKITRDTLRDPEDDVGERWELG